MSECNGSGPHGRCCQENQPQTGHCHASRGVNIPGSQEERGSGNTIPCGCRNGLNPGDGRCKCDGTG